MNDKARFFEIARRSALECAAIHDELRGCAGIDDEPHVGGKSQLKRIASMLTRLIQRSHRQDRISGDRTWIVTGQCAMSLLFQLVCLCIQTGTTEYQEPAAEINWTTSTDAESYYNSNLTIPRLHATPAWTEAQENPPLSARKAIVAAGSIMRKLAPYGKDAKLAPPTLKLRENSGRWFWVVYFTPEDERRFISTFPVIVLMDGSAIEPRRIPAPPSQLGDQ